MTFQPKKLKSIIITSFLLSLLLLIFVFFITGFLLFLFIQQWLPAFLIALLISLATSLYAFVSMTHLYRNRQKVMKIPFPEEWKRLLETQVSYYSSLNHEEKSDFQRQIQFFISEKKIIGIETEVDELCKILIASSAVIPIFRFKDWEYNDLSEILVYPDNFNINYEVAGDSANIMGLVTNGGSTMVLSKGSLLSGFRNNQDKTNVGFHEFAHKLDGQDGVIDGIPALLMNQKKCLKPWCIYVYPIELPFPNQV